MTFTYELDPYSLDIYGYANMNFPRGFRKLSSDRQTQTKLYTNKRNVHISLLVHIYFKIKKNPVLECFAPVRP